MTLSLLATLVGIGIVDSLNPSLFIAQFYLLTTPKPTHRILAYIAGVWIVMVLGGLLILGGFRTVVTQFLANIPPEMGILAQLVLSVILIAFGLLYRPRPTEPSETQKPRGLTLQASFILGAVVMVNELTTALPFFFAIERIAEAELNGLQSVFAIVWYNIFFSLPLFAFLGAFLRFKERFMVQITAINTWMSIWTPRLMKYGSLLLGLLTLTDGVLVSLEGVGF